MDIYGNADSFGYLRFFIARSSNTHLALHNDVGPELLSVEKQGLSANPRRTSGKSWGMSFRDFQPSYPSKLIRSSYAILRTCRETRPNLSGATTCKMRP